MTAGTTLRFLRGRGAPSDAARTALRRKIDEILEISGQENWDGEGALAVAPRTAAIARTLTAWIPGGILAPNADLDVSATPHGEVDFDWETPGGATLVVSVGPENDIAFYFQLPDGTRAKGREAWTGTLPHFTGCCFERLRDSLAVR